MILINKSGSVVYDTRNPDIPETLGDFIRNSTEGIVKGFHVVQNLTEISVEPATLLDLINQTNEESNSSVYKISKPEFKEPVKLTMNKSDKFKVSMAREATKLVFAEKRENYKKQMKHSSSIKSDMSALTKKTTSSKSNKSNNFKKESVK